MSRKRIVAPGLYHHIYNRGNDRQPIFKQQIDYQKYLHYLSYYRMKHKIDIIAYALMEWHMHLFIYDPLGTLSLFMKNLHGHYAHFFNRCYERSGHVFGRRFCNKIIDANSYGIWLSRYIHRQAVEAGVATTPEDYPWTSYRVYMGFFRDNFVSYDIIMEQFGRDFLDASKAYQLFVKGDDDGPINWKLTESNENLVIGNKNFINEIACRLKLNNIIIPDIKSALTQICSEYDISLKILRFPEGKNQRLIRRHAIFTLGKKYGIGNKEIAETLNISPGLVSMILRNTCV